MQNLQIRHPLSFNYVLHDNFKFKILDFPNAMPKDMLKPHTAKLLLVSLRPELRTESKVRWAELPAFTLPLSSKKLKERIKGPTRA